MPDSSRRIHRASIKTFRAKNNNLHSVYLIAHFHLNHLLHTLHRIAFAFSPTPILNMISFQSFSISLCSLCFLSLEAKNNCTLKFGGVIKNEFCVSGSTIQMENGTRNEFRSLFFVLLCVPVVRVCVSDSFIHIYRLLLFIGILNTNMRAMEYIYVNLYQRVYIYTVRTFSFALFFYSRIYLIFFHFI